MYTIDDLHYNGGGVIQVSASNEPLDLQPALDGLESRLASGSKLEQAMLSFFLNEVEPQMAYLDNDVNQAPDGPRRLCVVGKLKRMHEGPGLFVRIGIEAPWLRPLIPTVQALYLVEGVHGRYAQGAVVGSVSVADRWVYEFTERYGGMVEGMQLLTREGLRSIAVIPAINEAILSEGAALDAVG